MVEYETVVSGVNTSGPVDDALKRILGAGPSVAKKLMQERLVSFISNPSKKTESELTHVIELGIINLVVGPAVVDYEYPAVACVIANNDKNRVVAVPQSSSALAALPKLNRILSGPIRVGDYTLDLGD
jgi:hypothetical protein